MVSASSGSVDELINFDREKARSVSGLLAGVDEAGRGALAGPVVAAAVICEPCGELSDVRDSKLLSESRREHLYEIILRKSIACSTGMAGPVEIDRINILNATLKAMRDAVTGLGLAPALVLVDGTHLPEIEFRSEAVTGGDRKSFSVAAASIVAKVTRDRIMREREIEFPGYGFRRNKGYGTSEHMLAIAEKGRTSIHRRSFRTRCDR